MQIENPIISLKSCVFKNILMPDKVIDDNDLQSKKYSFV